MVLISSSILSTIGFLFDFEASKSNKKPMVDKIDEEINTIKKEFNIDQHYLESLLD